MENQSSCEHEEKSKNLSENWTWKECQNNKIIGNLKFKTIKIKNLRWGYYEIGIEIKENISWKKSIGEEDLLFDTKKAYTWGFPGLEKDANKEKKYKCIFFSFKTDIIAVIGKHMIKNQSNKNQ